MVFIQDTNEPLAELDQNSDLFHVIDPGDASDTPARAIADRERANRPADDDDDDDVSEIFFI